MQGFADQPAHASCAGGHDGIDEGQTGNTVGSTCRAGVEAEPAHPQQRCAHHGQSQVVGRQRFAAKAQALAQHIGAHQTGHTGVDVHNGAAGKVQRAVLAQQTTAPDHVGNRQVAQREPQHRKDHHGSKLDALGKGTDDQRHGDGGERGLERDEHILRHSGHRTRERIRGDAHQEHLAEVAKEVAFAGEGQRVAVDGPQHGDQRKDREHLGQHRQHVLAAHQTAVEQRQTRDDHQDHQHGRGHDPGGIARAQNGSCRISRSRVARSGHCHRRQPCQGK